MALAFWAVLRAVLNRPTAPAMALGFPLCAAWASAAADAATPRSGLFAKWLAEASRPATSPLCAAFTKRLAALMSCVVNPAMLPTPARFIPPVRASTQFPDCAACATRAAAVRSPNPATSRPASARGFAFPEAMEEMIALPNVAAYCAGMPRAEPSAAPNPAGAAIDAAIWAAILRPSFRPPLLTVNVCPGLPYAS